MFPPVAIALLIGAGLAAMLNGEKPNATNRLENSNCNSGDREDDKQQPSNPQPVELVRGNDEPTQEEPAQELPEPTAAAPRDAPNGDRSHGSDQIPTTEQRGELEHGTNIEEHR